MTSELQKCSECGQPKAASVTTGSFTQWISTCRCDVVESPKKLPLCKKCGLQIDAVTTGSFTQWVLQSQHCNCTVPEVVPDGIPAAVSVLDPARPTPQQSDEPPTSIHNLNNATFPLDRYKPIEQLGFGGAGSVFRCFDKHLRKDVAVKVLRIRTPEQLLGLQEEARVTAKFKHQNVVSIIDFGITQGSAPYMVLEYVEGQSLAELLERSGPLDESSVVTLATQISAALDKAHESSIFHRDIKSTNIIVSRNPDDSLTANIIDFGIAVVVDQRKTNFQGRTLVGTPKYMSPDQLLGRKFDARSEIYSLGCVMYEMLSGSLPFDGNEPLAILDMHAYEPVPPLNIDSKNPTISPQLESIVMKCLEKAPENRYQSMKELSGALLQVTISEMPGSLAPAVSNPEYSQNNSKQTDDTPTHAGESTSTYLTLLLGVSVIAVLAAMIVIPLTYLGNDGGTKVKGAAVDKAGVVNEVNPLRKRQQRSPNVAFQPQPDKEFDQTDSIEDLLHTARDAERGYQFTRAKEVYSRALQVVAETKPSDKVAKANLLKLRAISERCQGQQDLALRDLTAAIELTPEDNSLYRERAICFFDGWHAEGFDTDIARAIRLAPNNFDNQLEKARFFAHFARVQSERAIKKALELRPTSGDCYAIDAYNQVMKGDRQKAANSCVRALSLEPRSAIVNQYVGIAEIQLGNRAEAIKHLEKSIRLAPYRWEPYHWIGSTLILYSKDKDPAIKYLDKAIALNSINPILYHGRAMALHKID
ncbi:MAG: protein kinase [Candidatus Obscuribacterales bacterium]|nr:protein kinase [Candidatus Obscuribacterales bacterium]